MECQVFICKKTNEHARIDAAKLPPRLRDGPKDLETHGLNRNQTHFQAKYERSENLQTSMVKCLIKLNGYTTAKLHTMRRLGLDV